MKIEQIYTGCIAHAAYYLESNGEAALFDPLRELQPYIERAEKDNARIKYVFETHFHADFVSGHLDLKKKANAEIVFGPTAKPQYEATVAEDNQIFHVIADLKQEKLAGHLFDSLRNKIMPLSDDLIVYPNHGAGSACGKMMSKETTDTLGNQKRVYYALDPKLSKAEFIEILLTGLTTPPVYFPQNVLLNIKGYESLDNILERALSPLNVNAFEAAANETGALILDTRNANDFAIGFIPNSVNIGIEGNFAQWVGEMIPDVKQPILLITELGKEEECAIRLSRVGYDNTLGFLQGGMNTWIEAGKEIDRSARISAQDLDCRFHTSPTRLE